MPSLALLALTLAGGPVLAAGAEPPPPPIEVLEAESLEWDAARGLGVARGGAVLRRGLVVLRAREVRYDARSGEVEAWGDVLLTEPGRALSASALRAVLAGPFEAREVVALVLEPAGGRPLDLSRCRTVDEARASGLRRLTVSADRVSGAAGAPAVEVDGARLTLCDCGAGPPSWELRAARASVAPGDGAWLRWPVLWVKPRLLSAPLRLLGLGEPPAIPVLALPVAYVPLADRRSGLLAPELQLGGAAGTAVGLPVYLTMGRSADATLTGLWAAGPPAGRRGMEGPGAAVELRWAPAAGAAGRARLLAWGAAPDWPRGAARPPGGARLALELAHGQPLSERVRLELDAALTGDPHVEDDLTPDALPRALDHRRSAAALTVRAGDVGLELDGAHLLPRAGLDAGCADPPAPCRPAPFGLAGSGLATFHRLPSASADLLPVRLLGPLRLAATLGAARFGPLFGETGDEGADGVGPGQRAWPGPAGPPCGGPTPCDATEADGRWQPGERLAALRAVARAELRAPFAAGGALRVEPWVATTAAAYALGAGQGGLAGARAVAGLAVWATAWRAFGEGERRVLHELEPRVAWVGAPAPAGPDLPGAAYDELDVAGPAAPGVPPALRRALTAQPGAFQQLELSLRSRLLLGPGTALVLAVGQDVDLAAGRRSESRVEGALHLGPLALEAAARLLAFGASLPAGAGPATRAAPGSILDAFTSLQAGARLAGELGELHAGFAAVGEGGSPRLLAGLEPLFDPRPAAQDALAAGQLGATARLAGATLGWDAWFHARPPPQPACPGGPTGGGFYQHRAVALWESPCRCWRAGVTATFNACVDAQYRVVLDLSPLAERGMGR